MASTEDVYYLPTGWRIVGQGAGLIAERIAISDCVDRLVPGPVANTLYALQCTFARAKDGRSTVERILDAITGEVCLTWSECPRLSRDREVQRSPSRYGGLRYDILNEVGAEWVGEVIWRSVHPVVTGAPITTRVLIEESMSYTRLSVRVTADHGIGSVRGHIGAGQAQPSFLRAIVRDLTPFWLGTPLGVMRIPDRAGEIEHFVRDVLASEERDVPVVVLSPLEEGGYVIRPEELLVDLLGRAVLYVIQDHQQTFALTDTVGDRRMSCYWGAARAYMPGWSKHDDPYTHPLLMQDRLVDPVMRAAWLGELGIWMGTRLTLPPSVEERRARSSSPATSEDDASLPELTTEQKEDARSIGTTDQVSVSSTGTSPTSERLSGPRQVRIEKAPEGDGAGEDGSQRILLTAVPLLESVLEEIRGLGRSVGVLADEIERLRTITAVRSAGTNAIERRLGHMEAILERLVSEIHVSADAVGDSYDSHELSVADESAAGEEPLTLIGVVRAAAESHADALVFLDSAYESALASPYEAPERVQAVLDAMARVARRRQDGILGTSLREAFNDLGIDYRPGIARTTPARLRQQYQFTYRGNEVIEAEEHIALGNTYDPRRCLRIYFSSRVPNELRFVIAHVGRHFIVASST